ncbi:MAG: hypothetical protein K0S00_3863 [Xanthobacteraceae bacterium]|nr:hypothetical protein [Xanthobacteraceae bacterium]
MRNGSWHTPEVLIYFCMALLTLLVGGWASKAQDLGEATAPLRSAFTSGMPVDLELVIASDVSTSMDAQEKQLQRDGFVAAFESVEVHKAISRGRLRRIAVIYVEWGGTDRQRVVLPWTLIDGAAASATFAERLAATFPARLTYGTAMGDGLVFGAGLFERNVFESERRVIDVSGDGMSNRGALLELVREKLLSEGIVINGLPIVYRDPNEGLSPEEATIINPTSNEELVAYFETEVIGGPGAFVVPVTSREHYAEAIRTKLVREIAGERPPGQCCATDISLAK